MFTSCPRVSSGELTITFIIEYSVVTNAIVETGFRVTRIGCCEEKRRGRNYIIIDDIHMTPAVALACLIFCQQLHYSCRWINMHAIYFQKWPLSAKNTLDLSSMVRCLRWHQRQFRCHLRHLTWHLRCLDYRFIYNVFRWHLASKTS